STRNAKRYASSASRTSPRSSAISPWCTRAFTIHCWIEPAHPARPNESASTAIRLRIAPFSSTVHQMRHDLDDFRRGPQDELREQPAHDRGRREVEHHRFHFGVRPFSFDGFVHDNRRRRIDEQRKGDRSDAVDDAGNADGRARDVDVQDAGIVCGHDADGVDARHHDVEHEQPPWYARRRKRKDLAIMRDAYALENRADNPNVEKPYERVGNGLRAFERPDAAHV